MPLRNSLRSTAWYHSRRGLPIAPSSRVATMKSSTFVSTGDKTALLPSPPSRSCPRARSGPKPGPIKGGRRKEVRRLLGVSFIRDGIERVPRYTHFPPSMELLLPNLYHQSSSGRRQDEEVACSRADLRPVRSCHCCATRLRHCRRSRILGSPPLPAGSRKN